MFRLCLFLSALVACGLPSALADTIQLKDKAAITGKVLTEKPDQIVVDIGYTVLVIPRNQVVKILKSDATAPAAKSDRIKQPLLAKSSLRSLTKSSWILAIPCWSSRETRL